MSNYFIKSIKQQVSVSRIINGELEAIKIRGDLQLDLSKFWLRFKQKIEYEADESLSFIVLSDDENFKIDADIVIAEQFSSSEYELSSLIFDNRTEHQHLITFPSIDINIEDMIPATTVNMQEDEPELEPEIEGDSLQSFFRKKTREIHREINKVTGGK